MRRALLLLLLVLLLPLAWLTTPAAHACSCVPVDAADVLADADAVVNGTYLGRDAPAPPIDGGPVLVGGEVDHRIDVDRVLKGAVRPGVLTLRSASAGATCGISGQPGERMTLPLNRRDDGAWTSSLCGQLAFRDGNLPPMPGGGGETGGADLAWLGVVLALGAIGIAAVGSRR